MKLKTGSAIWNYLKEEYEEDDTKHASSEFNSRIRITKGEGI